MALDLGLETQNECFKCGNIILTLHLGDNGYISNMGIYANSPLKKAMFYNCVSCFKIILEADIKINNGFKLKGYSNITVLHTGARNGSIDCLECLLPYVSLDDLFKEGFSESGLFGRTNSLGEAIIKGNNQTLSLLLDTILYLYKMEDKYGIISDANFYFSEKFCDLISLAVFKHKFKSLKLLLKTWDKIFSNEMFNNQALDFFLDSDFMVEDLECVKILIIWATRKRNDVIWNILGENVEPKK